LQYPILCGIANVLQYTFSGSHNHDQKYNYSKAHLNTLQILSEVFTKPKTACIGGNGDFFVRCCWEPTNKQTNKQTYSQASRQACMQASRAEQISVRLDKSCESHVNQCRILWGRGSTYYCVRQRIIVLKKKETQPQKYFLNCVGERSGLKPPLLTPPIFVSSDSSAYPLSCSPCSSQGRLDK
jgi:hypothetical protein